MTFLIESVRLYLSPMRIIRMRLRNKPSPGTYMAKVLESPQPQSFPLPTRSCVRFRTPLIGLVASRAAIIIRVGPALFRDWSPDSGDDSRTRGRVLCGSVRCSAWFGATASPLGPRRPHPVQHVE